MASGSQERTNEAKSPAQPRRKRRRYPKGGPTRAELKKLREKLLGLRATILRSSKNLADEALKGSGQDYSVDHMADHGTDNFDQDFSLSLLEGEAELFRDIQHALDKIDGQGELPYGICENCSDEQPEEGSDERCGTCPWIAKGRLEAVPYARLCVVQQEIEEEGG
jgi:DnaK suppressor protein